MTKQITLEEALEPVKFRQTPDGNWHVNTVKGDCATVEGSCGTVKGHCGTVKGHCSTVGGKVLNTINGRKWQYVETPKDKLKRLIEETDNQELIDAFNQLEDN